MGVTRYLQHYFTPTTHNHYRPRVLHKAWLVFFMTVVLAAEGFLVSNLVARQSSPKFLAAVVPAEIVALTNDERASNDVGNLATSELLTKAAQAKAEDMAKNGYFSHTGPDGKAPWQWIAEAGFAYQYAGENLAVRFIDSRDVVDAWMVSPSHRANIVKGVYTVIGVGVAQGFYEGEPATYVVQYFATPKGVSATASKPTASKPVTAIPATTTAKPKVESKVIESSLAGQATTTVPIAAVEQKHDVAGVTVDHTLEAASVADAITQTQSFSQSIMRQLTRAFAEPRQTASMALGLSAAVVLIALLFAFFMHTQVQHPVMLATGATVVAIALFFLTLNIHLVGGINTPQTAAVQVSQGGVVITPQAADTGYALFP